MSGVNGWLLAVAFVLGLVLTFAFMLRWVRREVPVYEALGKGPLAQAPQPTATVSTASASAARSSDGDGIVGEPPYGIGSVRVIRGTEPAGYPIKGNEDSMLYHTVDSPSYAQTIAEVWFLDEQTAVRAGFAPWHKGRHQAD